MNPNSLSIQSSVLQGNSPIRPSIHPTRDLDRGTRQFSLKFFDHKIAYWINRHSWRRCRRLDFASQPIASSVVQAFVVRSTRIIIPPAGRPPAICECGGHPQVVTIHIRSANCVLNPQFTPDLNQDQAPWRDHQEQRRVHMRPAPFLVRCLF